MSLAFGATKVRSPCNSASHPNNVLLVKIEGPVSYTIIIYLLSKGIRKSVPLLIN